MPRENVPTPSAPEMQTPHLQMSVGPTQIEQVASYHRSEYYSTPSTKVDKAVKKEADSAAAKIPVTTGPVTGASSTRIVSEDGAFMDNVKAVESAFTEETKLNFGLRINTTPIPTSPLIDRRRPGPLDLTGAKTIAATAAAAATPGPLATARIIADINTVQYPDGIRSPHPELNQHAKEGKFRYDREFLLQFMSLCKEKPAMLPPLDAIGLEPTGQHHMSRGRSGGPGRKGAPLQASANRGDRKALAVDAESPEMVDRKVKGLLKKLTMEKFDSISDQIIAWANKSEKEKDGRTLIQVIRLVFEKATDEATWSEMYARLCRKMMEQISPKVQDDGIKNNEGKLIAGGQLFRKYLLNRCQEDFERGWVAKETTAAAAAAEATDDKAVKEANDKTKEDGKEDEEEYYAAQKAKRQGLGLIKFIGELFKLQMLTERIMHECVKKLLGNVDNPEEEEIESLCMLLNTVGGILDTPKARAHLDVYFSRMKELTKSPNVNSRMQYMLLDLIELRERKWISRTSVAAPSTIAQIHEAAAKEKAATEKESYQRQMSMSRGGSRRGGDRNDYPQVGPDGWAVAGGGSGPPRPPPKAGDLSNFGKIGKPSGAPINFGPSSVFTAKKDSKRDSISRTSSSSNMFSMLSSQAAEATEAAPKASTEPVQRKRLVLQPRSKPVESENAESQSPVAGSDAGGSEEENQAEAETMSDEVAKKKIAEDSKEFFAVRNLEEAEVYFTALPATHHHKLVDNFASKAVESKEADAQLVADFFARSTDKCSAAAFEEGFSGLAEFIEDVAIDAPKAVQLFALMIKGAKLDEEARARIAAKSSDSNKLLALLQ